MGLLVARLAVLLLLPHALGCALDQFYTPQTCVHKYVTAVYGCSKCPENAVQYQQADESCVCKPGFYATGAYNRCWEYKGNGGVENVVWPLVEDTFTCIKCGDQEQCLGGAYQVPTSINEKFYLYCDGCTVSEDFYLKCETSETCPSGYRRYDVSDGGGVSANWALKHAPNRRCKIFGQQGGKGPCACPANSEVAYSVLDVHVAETPVLAIGSVWNYNAVPGFQPPQPGTLGKYFGRYRMFCLPCLLS